jgi:hypothetical protein
VAAPHPGRAGQAAASGLLLALHLVVAVLVLAIRIPYTLLGIAARTAATTELRLSARTGRDRSARPPASPSHTHSSTEFAAIYRRTTNSPTDQQRSNTVTSQTHVNGATRHPVVPVLGDWQPIHLAGMPDTEPESPRPSPAPPPSPPSTTSPSPKPRRSASSPRPRPRPSASGLKAKQTPPATLAAEQAEDLRIANERKRMRLEKDQATHELELAEKAAKKAAAEAAREKAEKAATDGPRRKPQRTAEQQRTESWWKWGARGIYLVGLAIAAPVQFLDFWDPHRRFLVAAPALLEGLALVLAAGAAWAVAHRRDVLPYRIGIMIGAAIAAGINLARRPDQPRDRPQRRHHRRHRLPRRPDRADGLRARHRPEGRRHPVVAGDPRRREEGRRGAGREGRGEGRAGGCRAKAAEEKAAREAAAEAEQKRKDDDRKNGHEDVWEVAEALRSARGCRSSPTRSGPRRGCS